MKISGEVLKQLKQTLTKLEPESNRYKQVLAMIDSLEVKQAEFDYELETIEIKETE